MKVKLLCSISFVLAFFDIQSRLPEIDKITGQKNVAVKDTIVPAETKALLLKDINNDKVPDTAFVYTPPTLASVDEEGEIEFGMGCADNNCFNKISFSCRLPEMIIKESVWGNIENAGDLNGDGISELLFEPGWFTSSLGHLYLYSLRNGKWDIITTVKHRTDGEPLLPNLIRKGKKYYLQGHDYWNDDRPYKVLVKFGSDNTGNKKSN